MRYDEFLGKVEERHSTLSPLDIYANIQRFQFMAEEGNSMLSPLNVENPDSIKAALERALKVTQEGTPAVIEFIVDGWDFAPGFLNYQRRLA